MDQAPIRKTSTAYGVFIIESLREGEFKDGEHLNAVLELCRINSFYKSVSSKPEFLQALVDFNKSGFRYLHISCHADQKGLEIGGEDVPSEELLAGLKGNINGRRVFLSACKGSNLLMATIVIGKCRGQSVIGSPDDKAALFWPSFYYVVNRIDKEKMNQRSLSKSIQKCIDLFDVSINYYHRSKRARHLKRYKFRSNKDLERNTIQMSSEI